MSSPSPGSSPFARPLAGPSPTGEPLPDPSVVDPPVIDRFLDAVPADGTCLVLSPHLDDAVLSCARVLTALAGRRRVVVATVFTDSGPAPWPPIGRRIARGCGHGDPSALAAARRQEDHDVLALAGARPRHLGFVEAPYRRAGRTGPGARGRPLYPTFRFDALRGRLSRHDRPLADRLRTRLAELVDAEGAALVLAPLGVGRHVDHLLVRDAAATLPPGCGAALAYYSDFPYSSRSRPDPRFLDAHALTPVELARDPAAFDALFTGYTSQYGVLFPTGTVPATPEQYWLLSRHRRA